MAEFATHPSLKGAQVFITGGASGIGASLVEQFAQQGARVGYIDLNRDAAEVLNRRLSEQAMETPWFREVDVTEAGALKASVTDFAGQAGGLSVLVNNVANDTRHDPLDLTEEAWRAGLAVNLDSTFFACQAAIPLMQAGGGGSIINLSSINAVLGPANMPAYVAAKSALLGLTKSLAREYGRDWVRVNAILPGWVVTDRQLELWMTEEAEAAWMEQVALKARIEPVDVARLALFLASADSRMITGQQFVIDGGRI